MNTTTTTTIAQHWVSEKKTPQPSLVTNGPVAHAATPSCLSASWSSTNHSIIREYRIHSIHGTYCIHEDLWWWQISFQAKFLERCVQILLTFVGGRCDVYQHETHPLPGTCHGVMKLLQRWLHLFLGTCRRNTKHGSREWHAKYWTISMAFLCLPTNSSARSAHPFACFALCAFARLLTQ